MDVRFYERVAMGYRIPIKGGETRLAFDAYLLNVRVHVLTADYQLIRDSKQSARGYCCAKVIVVKVSIELTYLFTLYYASHTPRHVIFPPDPARR